MKLELNSGLFSVQNPDGYWIFAGLQDSIEESANWQHDDDRTLPDGHPALFPELEGNLEIPNPDWRPGRYELDYGKFLDILAQLWVYRFDDSLSEAGIKAKARFAGHWSPGEYNFHGDEADFTLTISKAEVERLVASCLADERFPQRLKDLYSSRDGFISFLTDNVEEFVENAKGLHGQREYERAVWQAVNFMLFPDSEASEAWSERFVGNAWELDFSEALFFVAGDETEEAAL
jgi:hypothetical protein